MEYRIDMTVNGRRMNIHVSEDELAKDNAVDTILDEFKRAAEKAKLAGPTEGEKKKTTRDKAMMNRDELTRLGATVRRFSSYS